MHLSLSPIDRAEIIIEVLDLERADIVADYARHAGLPNAANLAHHGLGLAIDRAVAGLVGIASDLTDELEAAFALHSAVS